MPSTTTLILRDARPPDRSAIPEVLTAAFADTDVGRWLDPDPETRRTHALAHFDRTTERALASGTVRVADEGGEILAAALWFPYPPKADPVTERTPQPLTADGGAGRPLGDVLERHRLLDRLLEERHPGSPAHHHLAYLGVRPDRQCQGIGSYLLIGHHAYLHVAGIPAYLEASDPRNRELYLRHGYTDVGVPIVLPGGIPIWPMWRPPAPAGAIASAAIVSSSDSPLARLARRSLRPVGLRESRGTA